MSLLRSSTRQGEVEATECTFEVTPAQAEPSRAGVPKFPNKSELSRATLNLEQPAPDGSKEVRSVLGGGEKGDYFVHHLVAYLHTSSFKTRSCQNDTMVYGKHCVLQNEELFQISFHFWFLVLEYQARHTKHILRVLLKILLIEL